MDDLVGRMTLEEKVGQMMDRAPAIPRLQVPEYNWWNEALHGVGRAGLATVFPQAIGFAATWNDALIHRMATVISDEARAKHHDAVRKGNRDRYFGLTIWSPNINLFRDPRWGRGQETYGEDPFLAARLAVNFVRGLQGDDPKYLKTVSTVKHYAVHSGPEPERHTFDAVVDERTLHEEYLRHFEIAIREGGAYSVMCAYNRLNGQPACRSDVLLRDILRGQWRFPNELPADPVTPLRGIREAVGKPTTVIFAAGSDLAEGMPRPEKYSTRKPGLPSGVNSTGAGTTSYTARTRTRRRGVSSRNSRYLTVPTRPSL